MLTLNDYLNEKTLEELQSSFSVAAGCPVWICGTRVRPLIQATSDEQTNEMPLLFPVTLHEELVGQVRILRRALMDVPDEYHTHLGAMMAEMLARLGDGASVVRGRVEQLLALHRVMEEFAASSDVQSVLDTVTRVVVESMKVKASSVRLISEDRKTLTIRSVHSFTPQYLDKEPIRLEDSKIDQEALRSETPVYVEDMTTDPRVRRPLEAKREGVVSALGAPMTFQNRTEGVLRVFTGQRHRFDWFERQLLQTIANAAAAAIVHARREEDLRESWEMKRQLQLAGEVQRRMLPEKAPKIEGFDIAGFYVPSQELAGDFYDYISLPEGNWGLAICDVVGKGVRASLLMASIRAALRAHAVNVYDLATVFHLVNRDLVADTLLSDFATLFYGVLNVESRRLTYSSAGHLPPMLYRNGEVQRLGVGGGLLGVIDEMEFPTDHVELLPGDIVLAFTDGLSEAANFNGDLYGLDRIEEALRFSGERGYSAKNLLRYCVWDMHRFTGLHANSDDLTLIAIRVTEEGESDVASGEA